MKRELEENKKKFIELLLSTKREGMDKLVNYLENETDFFEAPASTKYHSSYVGGLLIHSLNVFKRLMQLRISDNEELTKESENTKIIVALLHDICKTNFYKISEKNVKDKEGNWVKQPYYIADDKFPVGHGEKSVIILQKFINLTDDEILAIRWHMGAYDPKDNYQQLGNSFNKSPLAVSLHIADLQATYLDEN